MKKRCTNSSCRRLFSAEADACPWCGKKYPRNAGKYEVVYYGCTTPGSRHDTVFALRELHKMSFNEPLSIKKAFWRTGTPENPVAIWSGESMDEANKWLRSLSAAGAMVSLRAPKSYEIEMAKKRNAKKRNAKKKSKLSSRINNSKPSKKMSKGQTR